MSDPALHVKRWTSALVLAPIRLYRRFISPGLPPRCKYYPSCSRYAEEAITELGVIRGTILAVWRVLRCNPMSWGGVDELGDRKLFRGTPLRSELTGDAAHPHDHRMEAA